MGILQVFDKITSFQSLIPERQVNTHWQRHGGKLIPALDRPESLSDDEHDIVGVAPLAKLYVEDDDEVFLMDKNVSGEVQKMSDCAENVVDKDAMQSQPSRVFSHETTVADYLVQR